MVWTTRHLRIYGIENSSLAHRANQLKVELLKPLNQWIIIIFCAGITIGVSQAWFAWSWLVRLVPPGTSYTSTKVSLNSKYFQVLAVTNLCSHRRIAWTESPPCKTPISYNEYKTLPSHAHAFRWDQHHSTQSEERWGYSLVSPVSRGKDLLQLQSN